MTLNSLEFIHRFALHILPKGFVRIRHYGILSSTSKATCAVIIKEQLPPLPQPVKPIREPYNPLQCPCCKKETMQTIMRFTGPPAGWEDIAKDLLECMS